MSFFTGRLGIGHDRLDALKELTEYEYFEPAPYDPHYKHISSYFKNELDFAYFVVKFGWTREQYDSLTEVERLLILKQIETETVQEQEKLQATFELAISNVMRKKGKKYRKLFKRVKKKLKDEQPITKDEAKQIKKALAKRMGIPKPNK